VTVPGPVGGESLVARVEQQQREIYALRETLDIVLFVLAGEVDDDVKKESFRGIMAAQKMPSIGTDLDNLLEASARDAQGARVRSLLRRVRES